MENNIVCEYVNKWTNPPWSSFLPSEVAWLPASPAVLHSQLTPVTEASCQTGLWIPVHLCCGWTSSHWNLGWYWFSFSFSNSCLLGFFVIVPPPFISQIIGVWEAALSFSRWVLLSASKSWFNLNDFWHNFENETVYQYYVSRSSYISVLELLQLSEYMSFIKKEPSFKWIKLTLNTWGCFEDSSRLFFLFSIAYITMIPTVLK